MPDKQTIPDWRERIQEHPDVGNLPLRNREEVIQELAVHLEGRPAYIGNFPVKPGSPKPEARSRYSFGATYSFGLADPSPKKN
jgi:hypothetical protein